MLLSQIAVTYPSVVTNRPLSHFYLQCRDEISLALKIGEAPKTEFPRTQARRVFECSRFQNTEYRYQLWYQMLKCVATMKKCMVCTSQRGLFKEFIFEARLNSSLRECFVGNRSFKRMRCLLTPSFKTGIMWKWVGLSAFINTLTAKYPTQPMALRVERL
jgi:hypothetical protein